MQHVVVTGRGAPPALIELADTATDMQLLGTPLPAALPPAGDRVVSARAILVAAAASGQGQTTVTAALAWRLRRDGAQVRVFKTGPDFLDPLTLARASARRVDTRIYGWWAKPAAASAWPPPPNADWILVEADGLITTARPRPPTWPIAFGLPVLAVLDARAMAQTAGALALGLRDYGPVQLAGDAGQPGGRRQPRRHGG